MIRFGRVGALRRISVDESKVSRKGRYLARCINSSQVKSPLIRLLVFGEMRYDWIACREYVNGVQLLRQNDTNRHCIAHELRRIGNIIVYSQ